MGFDQKKCLQVSRSPTVTLPPREAITNPTHSFRLSKDASFWLHCSAGRRQQLGLACFKLKGTTTTGILWVAWQCWSRWARQLCSRGIIWYCRMLLFSFLSCFIFLCLLASGMYLNYISFLSVAFVCLFYFLCFHLILLTLKLPSQQAGRFFFSFFAFFVCEFATGIPQFKITEVDLQRPPK